MLTPRRFSKALVWAFIAACGVALVSAGRAGAQPLEPDQAVERTLELEPNRGVFWRIITPKAFKPDGAYPVLLVFGGGANNRLALGAAMNAFDGESRERGWVVAGMSRADEAKPYQPAIADVLAVMNAIQQHLRVEGGKFHLAGVSNGGIAALHVAIERPDLAASVTAFPGYPLPGDAPRLARLKGVPVRLFVGSDDQVEWTDAAKATLAQGQAAGLDIKLAVRPAQGHMIRDLSPKELLDMLEPFRNPAGTLSPLQAGVARTLDAFHDAASKALEARYFDLFAPEGVFIGTDAGERWSVEQFRAYARPIFAKGKGWTYRPTQRNIQILPGDNAAWFDELLENEKYGTCRGTGVLRLVEGRWLISQYHLTFPIPNALAERVTTMIKKDDERAKRK